MIQGGGFEIEREMNFFNSADLCNRSPIIIAWSLSPAQGPQKLNAFKVPVCLVHSKPPLELNSYLH